MTAAALLLVVAIGAFATSQIVFVKQLGVGTAVAVLIDATIVRALLVPALMKLLGERNWWAPPPLARLHARLRLGEARRAVSVSSSAYRHTPSSDAAASRSASSRSPSAKRTTARTTPASGSATATMYGKQSRAGDRASPRRLADARPRASRAHVASRTALEACKSTSAARRTRYGHSAVPTVSRSAARPRVRGWADLRRESEYRAAEHMQGACSASRLRARAARRPPAPARRCSWCTYRAPAAPGLARRRGARTPRSIRRSARLCQQINGYRAPRACGALTRLGRADAGGRAG